MEIKFLQTTKSWFVKICLFLLGLMMIWYWRSDLLEIFSRLGDRDLIVHYLQQYGALGPVILSGILMLQVFLAVIPGHAFIVAGGYAYGLIIGSLLTLISTVVASQLAFLLTRRFGRPLVDRMAPRQVVDYWNGLAKNQGALFFFFSFILPIFPNDLMSFVAALGTVSPKRFLVANFMGRLPCAILITLIGSHGFEMPISFWILIGVTLLGLFIIWKRMTPFLERHLLKPAQPVRI